MTEERIYRIRPLIEGDWPTVRAIYQAGIEGRMATFETEAPAAWGRWSGGKRPDCRFVIVDDADVVRGWAALSPTSKRPVYAGVCEVSIYLDGEMSGQGLGSRLMGHLVEASEAAGVWTLTASIFPENEASIALHKKFGFKVMGRRDRIAKLDGVWRDTVLMERRSPIVN